MLLPNATEPAPPGKVFVSISAGTRHTCGLQPDGLAVCWGDNGRGQSNPRGLN